MWRKELRKSHFQMGIVFMYLELQTRRRRRVQNVHEPLSCVQVSLHLTTECLSQVSIRTMSLNYDAFIPSILSCRFWLWVSVRLKRLFILTCKQARMGTSQAASDGER